MIEKKEENDIVMKILSENINCLKMLNILKCQKSEDIHLNDNVPSIEDSIEEYRNKMKTLKELYILIII